jgi:hypothetical protein
VVLGLACVSAIETASDVLEQAVNTGNEKEIVPLQELLEYALGASEIDIARDVATGRVFAEDAYAWCHDAAWNENLTWTGSGWTKTVKNVLAKGMPLPVKAGQCKIEDCPSCFWESVCSREETQALIDRSREIREKLLNQYEQQERTEREKTTYIE